MKSLTRNGKYCVSTVKIAKGFYETAVFKVNWIDTSSFSWTYEINYEEVDKINYSSWFDQFRYHELMREYWSLK